MSVFIEAVGFGVAAGAVIALGAVGFTVQFGISNVLNITYGALMTLAAYLGYALLSVGVGVWAALAVAAAGIAVASAGFNRLLIAPLRRRGTGFVGVVIVTVAAGSSSSTASSPSPGPTPSPTASRRAAPSAPPASSSLPAS
jgi:branched-subunit amino acid ABC-type transport system permease component